MKFSIALLAPALAVALITGCDSSGDMSTSLPSGGNGYASATGTGGGNGSQVAVGESCQSSDPNHMCLAIHFVTYKDSTGAPVANQAQTATIIHEMNSLWAQCNIGFQVENYEQVDPTTSGLDYGAAAQGEADRIRNAYGTISSELLAVTTGPWGTAVNAWTNMPGAAPYGAVMEASIVTYGSGIIYAHEFGHYLGLDHVSDTSDLMNPVIYTTSTKIDSGQCATARASVTGYWSAMLR